MMEHFQQYKKYIISGIVFIAVLVGIVVGLSRQDNEVSVYIPERMTEEAKNDKSVEVQVSKFKGSMYLESDKRKYRRGDEVRVYVRMNTQGYNINVAKAVVYYPQDKLEFVSFDFSDSVMTLKVREEIGKGVLTVIRGKPGDTDFTDFDDGYNGVDGLLGVVVFKAKESGKADIGLGQESRMLLDDGDGTYMDTSVNQITIDIN